VLHFFDVVRIVALRTPAAEGSRVVSADLGTSPVTTGQTRRARKIRWRVLDDDESRSLRPRRLDVWISTGSRPGIATALPPEMAGGSGPAVQEASARARARRACGVVEVPVTADVASIEPAIDVRRRMFAMTPAGDSV